MYLRLLLGNSRDNLSFADNAPGGVSNRLAVLRNETAQHDLYAVTDFLTGRFSQNSVSGLVLGRSADLISKYSYCDATTMEQYCALYASTLNLVAGVARRNIPTLRVIVPISDTVWSGSADALQQSKDFFPELFLPSLLKALSTQILEPQPFLLMLESSALCERVGGSDAAHVGADGLSAFLTKLQRMAATYSYLDSSVFFSWQPDGACRSEQLYADYLLKYALLWQNDAVCTFMVDFSLAEEKGEQSAAASIDYLARYINTDRCHDATRLALSTLGIDSLDALFADAAKLVQRRILRAELTRENYRTTPVLKGSFALWSFSLADDSLGWYEGTACRSFYVSSANQPTHALVAQFSDISSYGEIAYHFDTPVDLSFAPFLTLPVSVQAKQGTRYELQLRLIGDGAVTYASAVVEQGKNEQLYLDLSDASFALSELRAMRVLVRPLDGETENFELYFGGMTVQSATLSDAELSERVNAIWQNNAQDDVDSAVRDYTVPLAVTAIVAVASLCVCVLLILDRKRKKKRTAKS